MLRGGVAGRAEAQRHCHGKSKYYFFSTVPPSAFFLPVVRWFLLQFCWHRANPGNNVLPIEHVCVCGCASVCVCLCVGCGRWRWQIIAAISMTLPSLLSSLIFGVAWSGVRWGPGGGACLGKWQSFWLNFSWITIIGNCAHWHLLVKRWISALLGIEIALSNLATINWSA